MLTCTCDKSSKGRDIKIAEEEDNDDVKTWRAYGDSTRGPVLFVDSNGGKCLRCTGAVSCDSYFKECYENNDHTFFINSTGMADSHPMLELWTSQWSPPTARLSFISERDTSGNNPIVLGSSFEGNLKCVLSFLDHHHLKANNSQVLNPCRAVRGL